MSEYRFDPVRRRYLAPNGKVVSLEVVRALRDRWADIQADVIRGFAANVETGVWSLAEFEVATRAWLGETIGAGYQLGRGGAGMMTVDDAFELGRLISEQARKLELLIADQQTGRLSWAQFGAYAETQAGAAVHAFEVGQAQASGGLDLPGYPADNETSCYLNCLPGSELVTAPSVLAAYRRWFDGDMLTVRTAGGRQFAITPNHPVLTDHGWIAAGELRESHNLICGQLRDGLGGRDPNVYDEPTRIGEVFDALADVFGTERVVGVAMDFHGDGRQGQVDVVRTRRKLRYRIEAALNQHVAQFPLAFGNVRSVHGAGLHRSALGLGPLALAALGVMGGARQRLAFVGGHALHPKYVGFAAATNTDAMRDQHIANRFARAAERTGQGEFAFSRFVAPHDFSGGKVQVARRRLMPERNVPLSQTVTNGSVIDAKLSGQFRDTLAGEVERDQIVSIERNAFHGYVYNLETSTNWYVASGAIIHNCRCYWEIEDIGDAWECYWITVGDERVCPECEQRGAEWSPYVQAKQGW